jgi:hypothetical protein
MAREMTMLPAVSRVIVRACKIGTPLVTRVPRVREKREIEVLRIKSPKSGARSLIRSSAARPALVRATSL